MRTLSKLIALILVIALGSSCTTNKHVDKASFIQKRKYRKGYFLDITNKKVNNNSEQDSRESEIIEAQYIYPIKEDGIDNSRSESVLNPISFTNQVDDIEAETMTTELNKSFGKPKATRQKSNIFNERRIGEFNREFDEIPIEGSNKKDRTLDAVSFWSFILVCVGVVIPAYALYLIPISFVLGIIGVVRVSKKKDRLWGKGFAIFSIVTGLVFTLLVTIILLTFSLSGISIAF